MEKIIHYIKIAFSFIKSIFLLVSVFLLWHLVVSYLFEVRDFDDLKIPYALSGTILTIYLYGKRK